MVQEQNIFDLVDSSVCTSKPILLVFHRFNFKSYINCQTYQFILGLAYDNLYSFTNACRPYNLFAIKLFSDKSEVH